MGHSSKITTHRITVLETTGSRIAETVSSLQALKMMMLKQCTAPKVYVRFVYIFYNFDPSTYFLVYLATLAQNGNF